MSPLYSYLQHGRRHAPFPLGSDPIPGVGYVPFAALHTFGGAQTVSVAGGRHYFDMEDQVSGIFETSDENIFENAQNGALTGSPWGIKCLANGTYIVDENYFVSNGTGGATITCYHEFTGGNGPSFFQPGRIGALIGDTWDPGNPGKVHTFFTEWTDATDANPAPVYVNAYAELGSGSDVSINMQTMVRYLGPFAAAGI